MNFEPTELTLSETTFTAGTHTFSAQEAGQAPHAPSISGPGVEPASTEVLNPGDLDAQLAVTLGSGKGSPGRCVEPAGAAVRACCGACRMAGLDPRRVRAMGMAAGRDLPSDQPIEQ